MDAAELQKVFAGNIRKYRLLSNLTQMKLAETADISVGFLCDIENGKKWPTPETIVKLTAALNIEPYQLFMDDTGSNAADEVQIYRRDVSRQLKKSLEQAINDILKPEL